MALLSDWNTLENHHVLVLLLCVDKKGVVGENLMGGGTGIKILFLQIIFWAAIFFIRKKTGLFEVSHSLLFRNKKFMVGKMLT